ncbi:MAG: tRNA (adenosine(37)-N6)-dimethylallyltransferase MiaA [Bacteroidales bacterium]|jgi:tRNA dimethylallyltransferase|nr:tRNA (adenosine(37)-N6)-dimethylallyltransferase MiaA [Bacteroidales bacterium]
MAGEYNLLTILGPTAGGKTAVAARMAYLLEGEVISADSRQVYRGMDLGTGKDLDDYVVNGKKIHYHLIDLVDPGYKYNVYEYQRDFISVFYDLQKRNKFPVLCGGSGMYIEAIVKGYQLIRVPVNEKLRAGLESKTDDELVTILSSYKTLHNKTDIDTRKRMIRAIEIEAYYAEHPQAENDFPDITPLLVGVRFDRKSQRQRITQRLYQRLDQGMIEEVSQLLEQGTAVEDLLYYGLEYKFITLYLTGKLTRDEMFKKLETAIHQFAKRQMTWFRRMERNGFKIHWLDGYAPMHEKTNRILKLLNRK